MPSKILVGLFMVSDLFWVLVELVPQAFFVLITGKIFLKVRVIVVPAPASKVAPSSEQPKNQTDEQKEKECLKEQEWDQKEEDTSQDAR